MTGAMANTYRAPATQAAYADVVVDGLGRPVAGARVALYPVRAFAPGLLPVGVPAAQPLATTSTDAAGSFALRGLPPDDYHVLVTYVPAAPLAMPAAGDGTQTVWRYNVALGPYEAVRRTDAAGTAAAIPRSLARLRAGLPLTLLCVGDGATVGYNATGTVGGGWVAQLATLLASGYPGAQVVRYDPIGYAATLDAPIPAWMAVVVPAAVPAPTAGCSW